MQTFVLRKIGGTFDACRLAGGRPSVRRLGAAPSLLATVGAFARALVLPLIAFVIASALVWLATHLGHGVHSHIASLSLGGMAIGQTEELKKLHEEFNNVTLEFRKRNDQLEEERKRLGEATSETKSMLERLNGRLDEIETKFQRARLASAAGDGEPQDEKKALFEKKRFNSFLRGGEDALNVEERKALSTDSDQDGGYVNFPNVSTEILRKLILISPFKALCRVETISKGNEWDVPVEGTQNFAVGRVSQRGSRPQTNAGQLRFEKIPTHEYYAEPALTQQQIDDSSQDLEAWAGERVPDMLAQIQNQDYLTGTAVGMPEGLLTSSSVTAINSGNSSLITMDGMFDLMADLPTAYAKNGTIICNRKTTYALRKLKDSQNRYLWEPSPIAGNPASFDGRPVEEMPDMPDIAANAFPVAFGDFKRAYTVVDRQQVRLLRDPFTAKPYVLLYFTMRTGGQVVLGEAVRKLKIHT